MKILLSKRNIILLGILFLALLGLLLWSSNKLPGRYITLLEPRNVVASRPIFIEQYPTDFMAWTGDEYACTKTNIYVTNIFGTKERIFSDNKYKGDELSLFILSPDRMHALGEFGNQACEGADQEYAYFEYIDLFNNQVTLIAGKGNRIFDYLGNIAFSPDSKLIAFFNNEAMYLFNTKDGSIKKIITNLSAKPLEVYATNAEAQKSKLSHSPFVAFTEDNNKSIYQPRRNLVWKDDSTIYYYFDLIRDPSGFYSVNVSTAEMKKLPHYTYEQYQKLKKQNSKHHLSNIEYWVDTAEDSKNYQEDYCKTEAHYAICQI